MIWAIIIYNAVVVTISISLYMYYEANNMETSKNAIISSTGVMLSLIYVVLTIINVISLFFLWPFIKINILVFKEFKVV